MVEPINDDVKGAMNHFFFLNWSKICTSNNCATIKAVPDPTAILIVAQLLDVQIFDQLRKKKWYIQ